MNLTKRINHYFQASEFQSSSTQYHLIEIPTLCPQCGVGFGPTNEIQKNFIDRDNLFFFFTHKCNVCFKYSLTLQQKNDDQTDLLVLYPKEQERYFDPLINDLSPRFVSMYNSAFQTERSDSPELAGIGYRAAMELLIKDYALDFELASYEEIAKKILIAPSTPFLKTTTVRSFPLMLCAYLVITMPIGIKKKNNWIYKH